MSFTKPIVNAINKALQPHKETVDRIQALFLWIDTKCSCIFFILLESLFALAYFLPFTWSCNLCLIIGFFVLSYCLYSSFPSFFDKIFSLIKIDKVENSASNRIRKIPEIAAFLTTAISFWGAILKDTFKSADSTSIFDAIYAFCGLLAFFIFSFIFGDFWVIWIVFHSIFVFPSIILLPSVQKWLTENHETAAGNFRPASMAYPSNIFKNEEGSPDASENPQTDSNASEELHEKNE